MEAVRCLALAIPGLSSKLGKFFWANSRIVSNAIFALEVLARGYRTGASSLMQTLFPWRVADRDVFPFSRPWILFGVALRYEFSGDGRPVDRSSWNRLSHMLVSSSVNCEMFPLRRRWSRTGAIEGQTYLPLERGSPD